MSSKALEPHQRAHSKYSASGAERWTECTASVAASEGQPDVDTVWSKEGTEAHKWLEKILRAMLTPIRVNDRGAPTEMFGHALRAAQFIWKTGLQLRAEVLVETRVYLSFIHPEMFGTFDGAVLDHFGTLHVFDFKYGAGHAVSPGTRRKPNLQMLFYGIGLAHHYQWNFKVVRLWIIQPRIKGYDGPTFLDLTIEELRSWVPFFEDAVRRVETEPEFKEGSWCHWCKAKKVCPLKTVKVRDKAYDAFRANPITREVIDGEKEKENDTAKAGKKDKEQEQKVFKSESDWRKESRQKKKAQGSKGRAAFRAKRKSVEHADNDSDSDFDGWGAESDDFY